MKRRDYIDTRQGQRTQLRDRSANIIYINVEQEPKSKKSISLEEKISFQRKVNQDMGSKRAFQGEIALQIDFISTQDNPPAIQTLAKNYLDLLASPLPELCLRRKSLLYKDDRQIKFLTVNYHIDREARRVNLTPKPSIQITARPMRNILADLKLAHRIMNNDFINDNTCRWRDPPPYEKKFPEDDDDLDIRLVESVNLLREFQEDRNFFEEHYGALAYKNMKLAYSMRAQELHLERNEITVTRLLSTLELIKRKMNLKGILGDYIRAAKQDNRDWLLSSLFSLDLTQLPVQKEETETFKKAIRNAISTHSKEKDYLFPLVTPLAITIFLVPSSHQGIDLDNLVRSYVVPAVDEILRPPSIAFHGAPNNFSIPGSDDRDETRRIYARTPKHGITRYQVFELPRLEKDPRGGYVRLFFGNGLNSADFIQRLDAYLSDWCND